MGEADAQSGTTEEESTMTDAARRSPRAVIHKRILDRAEANPDASLAAIADDISGASAELVERVLDRYGDPADGQSEQASVDDADTVAQPATESQSTESEPDATPDAERQHMDFDELSDGQQDVLRAIRRHPEATQAELADRLGVSASTISNRVNSIEGFDWAEREAFVSQAVAPDSGAARESAVSDGGQAQTADVEGELSAIRERLTDIEHQLEETSDNPATDDPSPLTDSELLAKVVRACVAADDISDEEEVRILDHLLQ